MTSRSPLDLSQHEEAVASLRTGYRPACCCEASEVQVRSASAKNSLMGSLFWCVGLEPFFIGEVKTRCLL